MISVPFATSGARISPVSTMNSENVSLDIGIAGEEFQTHATRKLVLREGRCFILWIVMVLLEFVSLREIFNEPWD